MYPQLACGSVGGITNKLASGMAETPPLNQAHDARVRRDRVVAAIDGLEWEVRLPPMRAP